MKIPMFNPKPAILFNEFMDLLEEKHKFDHRNFAEKYPGEMSNYIKKLTAAWCAENGYAGKEYVLEKPTPGGPDWPKDSEEMRLRIEINSKISKVIQQKVDKMFPHQDFWHYILDCCGDEISNGSYFTLYLDPGETPWVNEILQYIKDAIKEPDSDWSAYDVEENCVNFYVSW